MQYKLEVYTCTLRVWNFSIATYYMLSKLKRLKWATSIRVPRINKSINADPSDLSLHVRVPHVWYTIGERLFCRINICSVRGHTADSHIPSIRIYDFIRMLSIFITFLRQTWNRSFDYRSSGTLLPDSVVTRLKPVV